MNNGRTKEGQENIVLREIKANGGFTIFWATDNQRRAKTVDWLIESGKIIRGKDVYPWCSYKINQRRSSAK